MPDQFTERNEKHAEETKSTALLEAVCIIRILLVLMLVKKQLDEAF